MQKLVPAAVFLVTLAVFAPAVRCAFVNWDDAHNFLLNEQYRGLSGANLHWMFTTSHMGHYQPLAWVTLAIDWLIWGLEPGGYHFTNVLLHSANAVFLYFLVLALLRCSPLVAGAAALLWALHPLRVESVTWVTERRDVLCALFYLPSILAYLRHTERPNEKRWLAISVALFTLSLLCKAWGVTLPLVLLVLDAWRGRRAAAEKLFYAAPAAIVAALAMWAVSDTDSIVGLQRHSVFTRAMQVLYGPGFYVGKTLAPIGLSPLYPLSGFRVGSIGTIAAVTLTVAATIAAVLLRRRAPAVLCAWVVSLLILAPVLGFVQIGHQVVADRYTYLAAIPWMILLAATLHRPRALIATVPVLAVLIALTVGQIGVWRDSSTLWAQALAVDPNNAPARMNRALLSAEAGNLDAALADFDEAVRLDPSLSQARNARAWARAAKGDNVGAMEDFDAAIRLEPRAAMFREGRAQIRLKLGDFDGAIEDASEAVRMRPGHAGAHAIRATALVRRGTLRQSAGDLAGAADDYMTALATAPRDWPHRAAVEARLAEIRRP